MKVRRITAIAMLTALGLKNANKLSSDKLAAKLNKLPDIAEEGQEVGDEKLQGIFDKALAKVAAGELIVVEAEAPAEEEATEEAPAKAAKKVPTKAAPKKASTKTQTTEVAGGTGVKKKKVKKTGPAKEPKPPKSTTAGVRNSRSRPYLAGIILKKHGLQDGITEEMIAELDEAYGSANPAESEGRLRNAWHAIRGFATKGNEGDLEVPTEE